MIWIYVFIRYRHQVRTGWMLGKYRWYMPRVRALFDTWRERGESLAYWVSYDR